MNINSIIDLNIRYNDGYTTFHYACIKEYLHVVKIFWKMLQKDLISRQIRTGDLQHAYQACNLLLQRGIYFRSVI